MILLRGGMTMVIWRRFLISLVVVFALVLAATPVALADPGTSVDIGSAADVPVGGSVDVEIRINTDEPEGIGQATITLTVDTAVVTVDDVTGTFNTVGDTTTMVAFWGSNEPTGDFLFATVTLTAVGDYEDCSNLDIAVTEMYNAVYQLIPPSPITDGTFCIQAAPSTPTPTPSPTPVTPTPSPTPVTPTPSPTPVTPTPSPTPVTPTPSPTPVTPTPSPTPVTPTPSPTPVTPTPSPTPVTPTPSPTPVTPTPSPTPVTPTPSPTPSPTPGPGNVSYIVIDPDTRSFVTGRTQEYTAEAFDVADISLGDRTSETTFSIDAGAGGSWAANVYTSDNIGTWIVTGTYLSFSDTATLTVRSASSGGGGGGGGGGGVTTQTFTVVWDGETTTASMTTSGRLLESLTATSADGLNELEIGTGTTILDSEGEVVELIQVTEATAPSVPTGTAVVGQAFDFGPGSMDFSKPVGITLGYNITDLPDDTIALNMVHFTGDGSSYELVETEDNQTAELGFLTGQADSFSIYAILADIPAFEVSELVIDPSRHETWGFPTFTAREGEEALITADVTNTGNYEATYTANLQLNGETVDSQTITLAPDQTGQVEFTISDIETGDYEIVLGDQSTTFESFFWINWLLIGIIIAAVILLALLAGWLFTRRNKTAAKPA